MVVEPQRSKVRAVSPNPDRGGWTHDSGVALASQVADCACHRPRGRASNLRRFHMGTEKVQAMVDSSSPFGGRPYPVPGLHLKVSRMQEAALADRRW